MRAGLTIGELAKALQLNPRTIRYYEGIGLLPRPGRTPAGYRLYSRQDLERLRLIKRAKLLGLSLAEIKPLADWAKDGRCTTLEHELLSLLQRKLDEVDQKIQELVNLKEELQGYCDRLRQQPGSGTRKEEDTATPAACQCLG